MRRGHGHNHHCHQDCHHPPHHHDDDDDDDDVFHDDNDGITMMMNLEFRSSQSISNICCHI